MQVGHKTRKESRNNRYNKVVNTVTSDFLSMASRLGTNLMQSDINEMFKLLQDTYTNDQSLKIAHNCLIRLVKNHSKANNFVLKTPTGLQSFTMESLTISQSDFEEIRSINEFISNVISMQDVERLYENEKISLGFVIFCLSCFSRVYCKKELLTLLNRLDKVQNSELGGFILCKMQSRVSNTSTECIKEFRIYLCPISSGVISRHVTKFGENLVNDGFQIDNSFRSFTTALGFSHINLSKFLKNVDKSFELIANSGCSTAILNGIRGSGDIPS